MALKYLNFTGLSTLVSDIKTWVLARIPTKTSEITNDSGFLTSHQSLSNYVTLNGAQTISAVKTFTAWPQIQGTRYPALELKNTAHQVGETPANDSWAFGEVLMKDKDNYSSGLMSLYYSTDKTLYLRIQARNKFTNGVPTIGGTKVGSCIDIGVTNTAVRYIFWNSYVNNNVVPLSNATNNLGDTSHKWNAVYAQEYHAYNVNAFMANYNGYTFLIRNDGGATYFLMSAQNGDEGTWTTARPLTINNATGVCSINGNAATATQFSANTTVALTGDATGTSAGSKKGWSVPVTLANSGVTAGTYGPSADVTGNNNATISVPEITVDSKGRVTSVVNRTLTCKNNTYSVYNKTLTIQKNGANVATFTSNSNSDVTANITVPTKTSELTNDSGYLTSHQSLSNYVTLNGAQTISGTKTFSAIQYFNEYKLVVKAANQTVGTTPSSNKWNGMVFQDTAGTNTFTIENGHIKNGSTQLNFSCTPNISGAAKETFLQYYCGTTEGASTLNILTATACAPTPATSDNSTKIATTAYVKAQGYLTSHQSLSNYSTLANTVKSLSISGKTITVTPGSGSAYTLTTQDTVYTHPTSAGNKHIPSGGAADQYLKYSASGTAVWADLIPIFSDEVFRWEDTVTVSAMYESSEWEAVTGGYKYTASISLGRTRLSRIYLYLTTEENDLVKVVITNGYVFGAKNCVDNGKNSVKADTTTYGGVLTQTVTGSSGLNCLFCAYNTTVTLTITYTANAHAGGANPSLSGVITIWQ